MNDISSAEPKRQASRRIVIAILGGLSVFMYVSIMLKIIKYGP